MSPLHLLEKINSYLHYVAGALLVATMLLVVINVVGRRFFSSPISGAVELVEMAMVLIVYLGFAHTQDKGEHIAVDIVYLKLPKKVQSVVNIIGGLLCMVVIGALTWQLYRFGLRMNEGGYTTSVLRVPLFVVAFIGAFGALMFTLALVNSVAKSVHSVGGPR